MTKIVISYRRDGTASIAGRIYDHLSQRFGHDAVFMDIDSIPVGVDFVAHLEEVLKNASLVVAIIGPDWVGRRSDVASRISSSGDFVRKEIEAAIQHGIPIVPALVEGAMMPAERDIPDSLAPILRINAMKVDSGKDFSNHIEGLIAAISNIIREQHRKDRPVPAPQPEVPLPRSVDRGDGLRSDAAGEAGIANYVYLSATKVALIHAQLPSPYPVPGWLSRLNPFPPRGHYDVGEEFEREPYIPSRRLLEMTGDVVKYIHQSGPLGTFEQPKRYIADTLPLRCGVVFDFMERIAFFGQRFEGNRYFALIGSTRSLIGSAGAQDASTHGGYYYTLKFLNARARDGGEVTHGSTSNNMYHSYLEAMQIALANVPAASHRYKFVAQLLHQEQNLVIATPIYVTAL